MTNGTRTWRHALSEPEEGTGETVLTRTPLDEKGRQVGEPQDLAVFAGTDEGRRIARSVLAELVRDSGRRA